MGLERIGSDGRLQAISRPAQDSNHAIFLYTGWLGRLFVDPMTFSKSTGILDRNLVLFNDPDRTIYHGKANSLRPDIDAIIEWQKNHLIKNPHIDTLYCAGTSSGAYAAALFGHYLGAKEVHAFGAMTLIDLDQLLHENSPYRNLQHQIDLRLFPEAHIDLKLLLDKGTGETQFHLYFSEDYAEDREQAERVASCPGVKLHPLPGRTHNVFDVKENLGLLQNLFSG